MTRNDPPVAVTLSFAQSLDGCIAARAGERTTLSGPEAMRLTHELRAAHDAILVGIDTVIADNPRLTVRLAQGKHPQPVILDSSLRMPLTCALLQAPVMPCWVVTTDAASIDRERALTQAGARVLRVPPDQDGRADLRAVLAELGARGVRSLMVEGGARVLRAFVAQGLAHRAVITIAPVILGGLNPFAGDAPLGAQLQDPQWRQLGRDMIVEGRLR